jgi:hypothetical protein
MAAPTVQAVNDIVNQLTAAYKPQADIIDNSIASNNASGADQIAGLDAKKTTAFKTIDQNANNRGMYFSGFRPNEQANYTGGTYLPALANLQNTIAATRESLLGKKADLATGTNTQAITINNQEKSAYQQWQDAQDAAARAEANQATQNAFTASENAKNRAASAAASAASIDPAKGYGMSHNTNGGLEFHGPNGSPVTLAQYASVTGTPIANLLAASGDATDAKILKAWNATNGDPNKLAKLAGQYSYVFGS